MFAQLPMLFMYYRELWSLPHYSLWPFVAMGFVIAFLFWRWPRDASSPFFASLWSAILFWAGVVFAICGTILLTPWLNGLSFLLVFTSLLSRTQDRLNPDRSLMVLSLPLWVFQKVENYDWGLITGLQQLSAAISSKYLDLLGYRHYLPGVELKFPSQKVYEIEQACSGISSFFSLMLCTALLIVIGRRPWFRSSLLLLSVPFWAVFMNSIRIMVIPIADISFGIDLKDGNSHAILGYVTLLIAIGMVFSLDQFFIFLFGRVDDDAMDSGHPMRRWISRLWNKIAAGGEVDEDAPRSRTRRRRTRPSWAFRMGLTVSAVLVGLLGILQSVDVQQTLMNPDIKVRFFASNVILPFFKEDAPPELVSNIGEQQYKWQLAEDGFRPEERKRGSDLGQRSDSWTYLSKSSDPFAAHLSVDQTFPGWHELTICYQNKGWKLERNSRQVLVGQYETDNTGEDGASEDNTWGFVRARFSMPATGERGFLLFAFCDGRGVPYDAPSAWGGIGSFVTRLKNRLGHQYRSRLFRGEAYQIQCFVQTNGKELSEAKKEEVVSQFLAFRNLARKKLIEKSSKEFDDSSDDTVANVDN